MSAYTVLAVFEYSTEAHLIKSKLDSENIRTLLTDENTEYHSVISYTVGGVKLKVHNEDLDKALKIYNEIRVYKTKENDESIHCPKCNSTRILTAPARRKNLFYMLFSFLEESKDICNDCKIIF